MTHNLTLYDIKTLKDKKRIGYVFSMLTISFGLLFNLIYFLISKSLPNSLLIGALNIVVIFLAYQVSRKVNHKVNLDLKNNEKIIVEKTVEAKSEAASHEAGSGVLYMPILGELFPKLWGQKMRKTNKYVFVANTGEYEVNKELYYSLQPGSPFYVHVAMNSGTILNITKENISL